MDFDRIKHSLAVARKMVEIGRKSELNEEQLEELFILGLNHDIGYEFAKEIKNHNIVGGKILKKNNYKYWQEVYYHGNPYSTYKSLYLDILNQADMQIDKYGNDVGYKKRLEDIANRYGVNSIQYINAYKIVSIINQK